MSHNDPIWDMMGQLFKQHPWHGISIGEKAPECVNCYIEMVPTDTVKYELDKATGLLKVNRPQKYSNVCPTLYGLIPQTYCAEKVGERCREVTGKPSVRGDDDPLDICVLTEKVISHGDILLHAYPIGGLRMIDGDEADDKIIAVMQDDRFYGHIREVSELPSPLIDRLKHYFLTYKETPDFLSQQGEKSSTVEIPEVYGREEAFNVIKRSQEDYQTHFSGIKKALTQMLRGPWN
jgi:inorganic pyrophosphatase